MPRREVSHELREVTLVPGNARSIGFKRQEPYLAQGCQRRRKTCLEEKTEGRDTPELSWGREPPAASVKQLPTHLAICEGSPYVLKCPACPGDSSKSHKCPALFGAMPGLVLISFGSALPSSRGSKWSRLGSILSNPRAQKYFWDDKSLLERHLMLSSKAKSGWKQDPPPCRSERRAGLGEVAGP